MKPQEILIIPIINYLHLVNSRLLFLPVERAHPTTSAFLLDLYRLIFIRGTFPSIWQKSIVVPIPKQGKDPMVDSNQRPMSCNTCKLMEKIVANRLLLE